MSDARAELSPEKRAELDKLALELVRGSVVEFAAARFIAMIVAEAHSHSAAELTRLRADLAAVERERDALIKALERLASPETFYAGGRVAPETFARMTYAKHILAGEDASDAKSFAIAAGFERAVNGAVDARAALEKPHG